MKKNESAFPREYVLMVLVQLMLSMSYYMVSPVLTRYLVSVGNSIALAGMLSGLLAYISLVIRPFSGLLADRWNPKLLLSGALLLFGISVIGYGAASNPTLFALFRVLSGVAFCLASTTIFAFAGQYIPDAKMGAGVGYLGLGNVVASAVGPLLGSALIGSFSFITAFLFAGVMPLAGAVIVVLLPDKAADHHETKDRRLHPGELISVRLIPIALLAALFSYTNSTVSNFLLLYAEEISLANASLYFSFLAVFLFVLRPISGRICDKYGLRFVLIPAFIVTMTGVLLIIFARSLPLLLLAAVLMAFGQGGGQPALQATCMRLLGPRHRGVATGTYYLFSDLVQGVAPTIGGVLIQSHGYTAAFGVCVLLFACGLVVYIFHLFRGSDRAEW